MGPYLYEVNENGRPIKVDKLRVLNGKGFGRLYSTGTSFLIQSIKTPLVNYLEIKMIKTTKMMCQMEI